MLSAAIIRRRAAWVLALTPLLWGAGSRAEEPGRQAEFVLKVDAGPFARKDTPIVLEFPAGDLPAKFWEKWTESPEGLIFQEIREGTAVGKSVLVQAERVSGSAEPTARWIWILAGETPAGTSRSFRFTGIGRRPAGDPAPWSLAERPEGYLELKSNDRTVFRYNTRPVRNPNFPEILAHDAYIHPAYTPAGTLITGDYSTFHPHQRGFFLAYTKTQFGDLHPDFWNIQGGTGKVYFDRLESMTAGPVTARFSTWHRWEVPGGKVALRERWDVEAYDIPESPYWLFDLTTTQRATDAPLVLPPYRYGGMAYRGQDPGIQGGIDVLTDGGSGRQERDQKLAKWVDLTGPIAEGSDQYAGAMIADHPRNENHPTITRIHTGNLPYFCYVPSHDREVVIGTETPTVFRYRILIHDGRPDAALDERIWRDFAEPPKASLVRSTE